MALWKTNLNKSKTGNNKVAITLSDGINREGTIFTLKPSEAWDSRNTSTRLYNALSVRLGSSTYATPLSIPNGAGVRDNTTMHVQDNTTWKYWNGSAYVEVATGLTNALAKFIEVNTELKRYTILVNGTDKKAWDGTTVIDLTEAPATRLFTFDDYRTYCVKDRILYCTAEGSITDYTSVGSDEILLAGMQGSETAIKAFNDMVIVWSEKTMHILYGNDPDDFYPADPVYYGCISDRSVIEHDSYLYWLDHGKFYRYLSGKPECISDKVKYYLDLINYANRHKAVCGGHGDCIYLSFPTSNVYNDITLEYDTKRNIWNVWSEGYNDFFNIGRSFYGIKPSGEVMQLNTGNYASTWYHITGMNFKSFNKQAISQIPMLVDLPTGSTLSVDFNTAINTPAWTNLYSFTASTEVQSQRIYIPTNELYDSEYYQLKFYGSGPATIYFVGEDSRVKAR